MGDCLMSHNIEDFDGSKPDREGDVSITVTNLTDVDLSSVSTSHVLKYNGTQWVSEPATQYLIIGEGISGVNYDTSHANNNPSTANHILRVYSENPINTISGATFTYSDNIAASSMINGAKYIITSAGTTDFTAIGSSSNNVGTSFTYSGDTGAASGTGVVRTNWIEEINLPAGTYFIQAQAVVKESTSNSYLTYEVEKTSNSARITPRAETGSGNQYGASSTACGTVTFTSSDAIRMVTVFSQNLATTANQTDECSKYNYIFVRKL